MLVGADWYIRGMRVLVAPDKFRGTLTAAQASRAVEAGWLRSRPGDDLELVPMADGGEGTLDALVDGFGGTLHEERSPGPSGESVTAAVRAGAGPAARRRRRDGARVGARAGARRPPRSPPHDHPGHRRADPACARARRPARVVVCIGGSATNDGGVGMAQALGCRFLDCRGGELGPGGGALVGPRADRRGRRRTRVAQPRGSWWRATSTTRCPVRTGPRRSYGPQKGADADDVRLLDRALGPARGGPARPRRRRGRDRAGRRRGRRAGVRPDGVPGSGGASGDRRGDGGDGFDERLARRRRGTHGRGEVRRAVVPREDRGRGARGAAAGAGAGPPWWAARRRRTPDGAGAVPIARGRFGEGRSTTGTRRLLESRRPTTGSDDGRSRHERRDRPLPRGGAALGLEPEPRRFPEGTKTAEDAARAIGCDVAQIVKSLVLAPTARRCWR